MQRKFFDMLLSVVGLVLTVALVVGGALLLWGANFANSNVHNQLAQQDIYFPTTAAFAAAKPGTEVTPGMKPYLLQYAGQEVLSGAQAEAYANHFIAVHLSEMPYGGVYSKVSAASRANPTNTALSQEVQTVFQGTTLRGLLLEAYGFSQFALIAEWGATACFIGAAIMLILVLIGFAHARRTPETEQLVVRTEEAKELIGV